MDLARSMKDKDFRVTERKIAMKEVAEAAHKGKVSDASCHHGFLTFY